MLLISALASGKTALIANCSPSKAHAEETSQTLLFASRANAVEACAVVPMNKMDRFLAEPRQENAQLREENNELKQVLHVKGILLPWDVAGDLLDGDDTTNAKERCVCFARKAKNVRHIEPSEKQTEQQKA
jgi:hypothetical protein